MAYKRNLSMKRCTVFNRLSCLVLMVVLPEMVACNFNTPAQVPVSQGSVSRVDLSGDIQSKGKLDVSFESDGHILSGMVMLPSTTSARMPAVIFLPGSGGSSSYSSNYKNFLAYFLESYRDTLGLVLMYFDKRGVGKSQGKWYDTDFEERALDARNAARFLATLPFVDKQQIYLVGHSQGGWIVQICLALYPDVFAGGISMAGATFGVEKHLINDYMTEYRCSKGLPEENAYHKAIKKARFDLNFVSVFPVKDNWKQLKIIKDFDPEQYIRRISIPILFLWGENDGLVDAEWGWQEIVRIFDDDIPQNFRFYTAQGANHAFKIAPMCYDGNWDEIRYDEATRKIVGDWLREQISLAGQVKSKDGH